VSVDSGVYLIAVDNMTGLSTLKRLLISAAMIMALIIASVPHVSGQSACLMGCSKEKPSCCSCCAGDSCGVSKSKTDASHSLVAPQRPLTYGSSYQALPIRTVLFILPSSAKLYPDSAVREIRHPGDRMAANCILLI
jgi:hypothetical protein